MCFLEDLCRTSRILLQIQMMQHQAGWPSLLPLRLRRIPRHHLPLLNLHHHRIPQKGRCSGESVFPSCIMMCTNLGLETEYIPMFSSRRLVYSCYDCRSCWHRPAGSSRLQGSVTRKARWVVHVQCVIGAGRGRRRFVCGHTLYRSKS